MPLAAGGSVLPVVALLVDLSLSFFLFDLDGSLELVDPCVELFDFLPELENRPFDAFSQSSGPPRKGCAE